MVFSAAGLGGMSHVYHELYRTRLCRGKFRDRVRPILVNNWEATYFNFNADKIEIHCAEREASLASSCSFWMMAGSASGITITARWETGSWIQEAAWRT